MSSNITDEKAIITLEVELVSSVSGLENAGETPNSFFEGVGGDEFQNVINQSIADGTKEAVEDAFQEEGIEIDDLKNVTNLVKDVDSKGMKNITSLGKNPEKFMEKTFMNVLSKAGPQGLLIAAILGTALASPEFVKAIVQMFGVKGGPLNQDYRLSQEEFMNQEFDRSVLFRRKTGDDPLITVTTTGFVTPSDPDFGGNSLINNNVSRTARIGLNYSAGGYVFGI